MAYSQSSIPGTCKIFLCTIAVFLFFLVNFALVASLMSLVDISFRSDDVSGESKNCL